MNRVIEAHKLEKSQLLQLVQGDLTLEAVDAIVNAANSHLQHGGGVAAAIVRRGGHEIQVQSSAWVREHGPVTHPAPAYTAAGSLPCKYVIHAVGPIWGEGDEDEKLRQAVNGSLRLADELSLTSIAFPAISTGIYGFPKERAAGMILDTIIDYFFSNPGSGLLVVRITLFDQVTLDAFLKIWKGKGLGGGA